MAKISFVSVPVTYSKPRDFALPIWDTLVPTVTISVPLALVGSLYKFTFLNASVSPDTKLISGDP